MAGTLTERIFTFSSGAGVNKYTFEIKVTSNEDLFILNIVTPNGTYNWDSGSLPESVIRDMDGALDTVRAGL